MPLFKIIGCNFWELTSSLNDPLWFKVIFCVWVKVWPTFLGLYIVHYTRNSRDFKMKIFHFCLFAIRFYLIRALKSHTHQNLTLRFVWKNLTVRREWGKQWMNGKPFNDRFLSISVLIINLILAKDYRIKMCKVLGLRFSIVGVNKGKRLESFDVTFAITRMFTKWNWNSSWWFDAV